MKIQSPGTSALSQARHARYRRKYKETIGYSEKSGGGKWNEYTENSVEERLEYKCGGKIIVHPNGSRQQCARGKLRADEITLSP